MNVTTEQEYVGCNKWLNAEDDGDDRVQKICEELSDLGAKYHAGDRNPSTAAKIWKCTEALVGEGGATNMQCHEVPRQLLNDCEHVPGVSKKPACVWSSLLLDFLPL